MEKCKKEAGLNTSPKNGFHPDRSGEPLRIFEGEIYFRYFGNTFLVFWNINMAEIYRLYQFSKNAYSLRKQFIEYISYST